MDVKLSKKPKNPIVIEGFPGFGLIGTITTEFLVEHLDCELIGKYWFDNIPATIAIHQERVIQPVGIYYNKKYNLVIIHSIIGTQGTEWDASDMILSVCKQVGAKMLISLEGVGSMQTTTTNIFYYSSDSKIKKKLDDIGVKPLKEGIIMGVTSAVLVKTNLPTTCIFAETHSELPDSKAAASVIETIDKLLGLKVDPKPLLKQAEMFETKLKGLMQKSQEAQALKDKKQLSYVG
jgi:uncharacterized protein